MSCVDENGVDCAEVIEQVYQYLDGELNDASIEQVRHHLDNCSPCFAEVGLEEKVRDLVAKSCACPTAPERLRQQILTRITEIRLSAGGAAVSASLTVMTSRDTTAD